MPESVSKIAFHGAMEAFLASHICFISSRNIVIHIWRCDALNDLYRKVIYSDTNVYAHDEHKPAHGAVACEKCVFKKRNKIITLAATAVISIPFRSINVAHFSPFAAWYFDAGVWSVWRGYASIQHYNFALIFSKKSPKKRNEKQRWKLQ